MNLVTRRQIEYPRPRHYQQFTYLLQAQKRKYTSNNTDTGEWEDIPEIQI